ncbi:MAG TPA: MFS transporter [Anaerolineales bacterium]|nr:MFS transporter [Anaerolineales bacterium]
MRDLVLLSASLLIWGMGEGIFLVFQPIYLEQFGASPSIIGLALGFYGAGQVLTHIPAGYLSDRYGPKPLMLAAWVCGSIAAWFMALAASLPAFIIGMMIYGTTLFALSPLNSYVTAARGNLSVGRAITLTSASFNMGWVLGPAIGGIIGEQMGLKTSYLIAAVLFFLSTLIVAFIRPRRSLEEKKEVPSGLGGNRAYLFFLAVVFLATFSSYLPQPLAPNFLQNQQSLNLQEIGWLYSILGVGIVLLNLLLGQLRASTGFILSQVAVAVFAGILWLASGLGWYAVGFFLLGGSRVARALLVARTRPLIGARQIGLAYAFTETVASFAVILAPVLAGLLYEIEPTLMFPIAVSLILASLLVDLLFRRNLSGLSKATGEVRLDAAGS